MPYTFIKYRALIFCLMMLLTTLPSFASEENEPFTSTPRTASADSVRGLSHESSTDLYKPDTKNLKKLFAKYQWPIEEAQKLFKAMTTTGVDSTLEQYKSGDLSTRSEAGSALIRLYALNHHEYPDQKEAILTTAIQILEDTYKKLLDLNNLQNPAFSKVTSDLFNFGNLLGGTEGSRLRNTYRQPTADYGIDPLQDEAAFEYGMIFGICGDIEQYVKYLTQAADNNFNAAIQALTALSRHQKNIAKGKTSVQSKCNLMRADMRHGRLGGQHYDNYRLGMTPTRQKRTLTEKELVAFIKEKMETKAQERRDAYKQRMERFEKEQNSYRERLKKSQVDPTVNNISFLDPTPSSSTTAESKKEAQKQIKKEQDKARLKSERPTGKQSSDTDTASNQADIESTSSERTYFIKSRVYEEAYTNLWKTTPGGSYQNNQLTFDDIIKISEEFKGTYDPSRGAGSHSMLFFDAPEIISFGDDTIELKKPEISKGALTAPKLNKNETAPAYLVKEFRDLLNKLGYTPDSVKPKDQEIENQIQQEEFNASKPKGKNKKNGKKRKNGKKK